MNTNNQLCVKLIHCGNRNISNPADQLTKSIFYIPMGLFPMASELKKNGCDVEIIHLDLEENRNIEKILDFATLDAVGLDCHWANQSLVVLETVRMIKKIKPAVFTFLGGFTASFFAREILTDYPAVDAVIRGDGEIPVVQLCRALRENSVNNNRHNHDNGLQSIPNLAWRGENGDVILNEFSYVANSEDLDRLDFAQLDLLRNWASYRDLCRYWSEFPSINQLPMFFLEVGRGCVYNCSFCGGNSRAQYCINNRKGYAIGSVDSVISTIKKVIDFGYSFLYICFEFEGSDEWFIQLFRRVKEENLKISVGYGCWQIPSKALIDMMSESCEQAVIEISPETSNLSLRKKNKDPRLFYTNRQLEECLDYIGAKANLKAQLYFGYFLPFETEDTVFNTIDYITELFVKYSHFTEILYMNLSTDPASLVYLSPGEYDVDIEVHNFGDYILKLEEVYVVKKETPRWLTLAKPRNMPQTKTFNLSKKIEFFGKIFSFFTQSILLILKRINKPDLISGYLRDCDFPESTDSNKPVEKMKNLILKICNDHYIEDVEITARIEEEFRKALVQSINVTSDNHYKRKEIKIITEDEKNMICSVIQKNRESIQVEFDL